MPLHELLQKLGKSHSKYEFKVNNNRSTMVSVKWEPDRTKVSLHKMFENAPRNIMDDLACYITKQSEEISPLVRAYIEDNLKKLDYRHTVDKKKLTVEGNVYNLKNLFNKVNHQYFNGKIDLFITWFGSPTKKNRTKVTFGLYHDATKLIKINRMMDSSTFPEYVISFVIYHEILHHVCPSYFDAKGKHLVHSPEFKKLEEKYEHFDLANEWIKKNQSKFFSYR